MKYNMRHLWFEKGGYANKKARSFLANDFDPTTIKKVAVIRHAALGDQVITRPFLVEARKFFPNAHITLCAVSNYQYGMPSDLVDSVHIMHGADRKHEINLSRKIANIKELPEQDIIFDLAATNRSYWMTALSKATLKIGFPYRPVLNRLLYDVAVFRSDFSPEIEAMLDMLRTLGHRPQYPLDFSYPTNNEHQNKATPFIIYFNGASQEAKMYPIQNQAELLQQAITALPDYQHVFLEGLNPKEKGDSLQYLADHKNFSIKPCLNLERLTLLLAQATAVVSTDTGVRNLAIATHTPTVGIFYSTVPFRYTPKYEYHHIVMNADASLPSPTQVLSGIKTTLKVIKRS